MRHRERVCSLSYQLALSEGDKNINKVPPVGGSWKTGQQDQGRHTHTHTRLVTQTNQILDFRHKR